MELDKGLERKILEWFDNILGVPTKELGLLAGDTVRRWRVMNQMKTLAKAYEKSSKLKLPLKVVSPKLICPLLEYCSLEDEEYMQDKWANMIVNMFDSERNVQNHVFPFILSQISQSEFIELRDFHDKHRIDLDALDKEIELIYEELLELLRNPDSRFTDTQLKIRQMKLTRDLRNLKDDRRDLTFLTLDNLEEYEVANLVRLGLLTALSVNTAVTNHDEKEISIEHLAYEHYVTELGEMFIKACLEA